MRVSITNYWHLAMALCERIYIEKKTIILINRNAYFVYIIRTSLIGQIHENTSISVPFKTKKVSNTKT